MRVSSINAVGSQQTTFNGSLSKPVKALLDSQTPIILEAKKCGKFSKQDIKSIFDIFSRDYDTIRGKMGEFSYSTVLSMKKTKSNRVLFYLENPNSDYKYLMNEISMHNSPITDINGFSALADMLEKVNPFEVENKFCIQRHSNVPREIFKPEIEL